MVVQLGFRSIVQGQSSACQAPGPTASIKRRGKKMVVLKQGVLEMATVWPRTRAVCLGAAPAETIITVEGTRYHYRPGCSALPACLGGRGV